MAAFHFHHPIHIRYKDIDAQRHVNSATYFTYMEQARAHYLQHLGLWDGQDFDRIGVILAEQRCAYERPIMLTQSLQVGVRTVRIGNKSLTMEYRLVDPSSDLTMATGHTTLVAYDYVEGKSIPVPSPWREAIQAFEGVDLEAS